MGTANRTKYFRKNRKHWDIYGNCKPHIQLILINIESSDCFGKKRWLTRSPQGDANFWSSVARKAQENIECDEILAEEEVITVKNINSQEFVTPYRIICNRMMKKLKNRTNGIFQRTKKFFCN